MKTNSDSQSLHLDSFSRQNVYFPDTLGCSYPQQEPTCEICSQPMEWEDCWNGCDDGYLSLYDEDPLFYDEDDQEVCDICDGKGGWWVCPVAYHHQKLEEPTP